MHGFGVDEDTGLYIENDTATVYGNWGVWVIDMNAATVSENTQHFSADNIRIHYLTEGDSYNLTSGIVLSTKSSINEVETAMEINNNIFGTDQGLRTIKSLISSTSTVSEGYSRDEDPTCMVVFEKDESTKGYFDDDLYTIQNLLLHVNTKSNSATTDSTTGDSTTGDSTTSDSTTSDSTPSDSATSYDIGILRIELILVIFMILF